MVNWLAVLVACGLQAAQVGAQRSVVLVFRIGLDHGDDRVARDEAGQVVDVAVGVVADDAASQPDGVRRAQIIGESFFVVDSRHVRIAFLHFAEQAFFGGENCAQSVDVDRAAFEHHARAHRDRGESPWRARLSPSGCRSFRRTASWSI